MKQTPLEPKLTSLRFNLISMIPCVFPLTALLCLLSVYPQIALDKMLEFRSFPLMGNFELYFCVDRLSLGFGVLVSALYLLVMIYSADYVTDHRLKYYVLLTLNFGSLLGLIFSQGLLGFYIFFETVSISAYFLIIHSREKAALDAGYKYIVMMLVGGLFILTAILVLFIVPLDKEYLGRLAGISFSIGCLLKAGAFPFHTWLPDAHPAAPSPISALLSGVMIKVGAYGLIRAFFSPDFFGTTSEGSRVFSFESLRSLSQGAANIDQWLVSPALLVMGTGVLSMVIGVSLALLQKDLKKLLAYHSVSQIGYILLGIGIGKYGLAGGMLHILSHAIFKGLLFLAVGAVIFRTGTRKIEMLGGLWRKMPVTTLTCLIAALSISGVPLTSGYASKGIIFAGLEGNLPLEIIFILTSAGTCASFLKLVRHTFFGPPNSVLLNVQEVPASMYIPMLFLSLGSFMVGIFPGFVLKVMLSRFAPQPRLWTLAHLAEAFVSLGIGVALYAFLLRMGVFGFHHPQTEVSKQRRIVSYFSVDSLYNSLARGLFALCLKLENIQDRSLSVSIQMVISFLVLILFMAFIL
ncbi:NADH dehydrogenase (Quinone) [Candidatus Vecturithrix granuli]|uniref:NADH dehydrogenase (Quinone) n=1 Tax=Vecturithrix granuli TaxID=1499967 RepID=A0A081BUB9_VECG1|nr:NADH dehydrogenase (Quinone) [Candidatus Vecturithrix granuli]